MKHICLMQFSSKSVGLVFACKKISSLGATASKNNHSMSACNKTERYEHAGGCIGSAITGPIGKECADLWPRIASAANAIV
jgi:hypothetical protein